MNEFAGYYKTLPTSQLLAIVTNPDDFQKTAVEAAQAEIASRNLTGAELDAAYDELAHQSAQASLELEQKQLRKKRYANVVVSIFDRFSPTSPGLSEGEKIVRRIVLAFSLIFLYTKIASFRSYIMVILDFPQLPFYSFLFLYPDVLLIVTLVYFHKMLPSGYTLMCFYCVHVSLALSFLFVQYLLPHYGLPTPVYQIIESLVAIIIHVGVIYFLSKESVREIFYASKRKFKSVIGTSIIISILMLTVIFVYMSAS